MTSKTIALSGAEIRADYSGGTNVWLRNDGTATVYASTMPGITAGADGVVSIPAGQAAAVYGAAGTVYLLGTGSVQLVGSDYTACPFKTSATSGGSGADEVARAAIEAHVGNADIHISAAEKATWDGKAELSDIPDKLPADGGNADKAKQVTCEGIIGTSDSCAYKTILDWANHYTNQGCAAWAFIVSGYGFPEDIPKQFEASVKIESDETGDRRIVTCTEYGTINSSYTRTIYNKSWYNEWQRTSDGGNAASVGTYTEAKIAALEARIAALEGGNV